MQIAAAHFPKQATGFLPQNGHLYQIVVTPVYVAAAQGSALLNVLVAGYAVDEQLAQQLKEATGGSDFVFASQGAGDRVDAGSGLGAAPAGAARKSEWVASG